jgi:photosystem II stability/assembly factor-like uncharacterized protein
MKQIAQMLLFAVLFCIYSYSVYGQIDDLKEQLKDKKSFSEITTTIQEYILKHPQDEETESIEEHFARWAFYRSLHLGPNGEMVNISKRTVKAVEKKKIDYSKGVSGNWTFVGPSITHNNNPSAKCCGLGRVDRIAFHPTNQNIIYVGTSAGGIWKTTDGGNTWISLSNFIPSLGISGIVVDHSNPNTIFVLTGDGDASNSTTFLNLSGYLRLSEGIFASYDGGTTWVKKASLYDGDFTGFCLVQSPVNADILLAGTSEGIYRSTDGGETWSLRLEHRCYDIEFKPGSSTTVYAAAFSTFSTCIYNSENNGETWIKNTGFNNYGRVELAVSPSEPNKVYALCGPGSDFNIFNGLYVSEDSGNSFNKICNSPNVFGKENGKGNQSFYDITITVSPTNDNIIITGGLIIYKSTDAGNTFEYNTTYCESDNYIHPDIHCVKFNPLNGYIYAATDGGFYKSTDEGETWEDISEGIAVSQFYKMVDQDATKYAILAGAQDNGTEYRTTATGNYAHIYGGDGYDVIIDYSDVSKGYTISNKNVYMFTNFTTQSPKRIFKGLNFFPEIEMNTSDPETIYIGQDRISEYNLDMFLHYLGDESIQGGWALKTCPSNSHVIYTAGGANFYSTTGNLFVTTNDGTDWSEISANTGFPTNYNRITDIGVKPNNSHYVWITFSGYTDNQKVYFSFNQGSSWTNKSLDLPNIPIWSIEVDANNNVYIGTDYGVFYLKNGATNWTPFFNKLPNVPVSELALNESENKLYASTFGRGIWGTATMQPCDEDVVISQQLKGRHFISASNSVRMLRKVYGGNGTKVWLKAGNQVDLQPGFDVDGTDENEFMAFLGNCNGGIPPEFTFGKPGDSINCKRNYKYTLARNLGTLQINDISNNEKKLTVRIFTDKTSNIYVFMTNETGGYIKDIIKFTASKRKYGYNFTVNDLKQGLYYLYLGVNDNINHLQELWIE